jgi:spore maturation protein CgeB
MRFVIFCHSIVSDWNHGNAHFLRGVGSELMARGHEVLFYEPRDAWSLRNLIANHGDTAITRFYRAYPRIVSCSYDPDTVDLDEALEGADVIIVHEWNSHEIVKRIGEHRARSRRYKLYFHDTHHRAVTEPESMSRYDLRHYDGVLVFGEVLRDVYLRRGWAREVWTWHEAADTRMFHPIQREKTDDLVWIGNWGDEERTAELNEFLIEPAKALSIRTRLYGVRYPESALMQLRDASIAYGGWLPNFDVPRAFAKSKLTIHVPRRPYLGALYGIPTIRPFEAMACGIPLISARWRDPEGLFSSGVDFLIANNGDEMKKYIRDLLNDPNMARELAMNGYRTIRARHTCAHRVDELMAIHQRLASTAGTQRSAA